MTAKNVIALYSIGTDEHRNASFKSCCHSLSLSRSLSFSLSLSQSVTSPWLYHTNSGYFHGKRYVRKQARTSEDIFSLSHAAFSACRWSHYSTAVV